LKQTHLWLEAAKNLKEESKMPESKKAPEIAALEVVYEALKGLDPELRRKVLQSTYALLEINAPVQKDQRAGGEIDSPRVGLAELIKEKQAITTSQFLAVFAYFREKYQKQSRFSRADLEGYFQMAKENPPTNYDRDFTDAVRKGWIHEEGENSFITSKGIEAVEGGFPGERKYNTRPGSKAHVGKPRKKIRK
jgi:hypothetical protein